MPIEVVPRQPGARCYRCADREVAMVCHHCGRPMCARHAPGRLRRWLTLRFNPEFKKLGIEGARTGTEATHCEDCRHAVVDYRRLLVAPGLVLVIVGSIRYLREQAGFGVPLALLGVALVLSGYWLYRGHYAVVPRESRPPAPLIPQCRKVNIREFVEARVTLDAEGRYSIEDLQQRGEIIVPMAFTRADWERCALYRSRYKVSAEDDPIFHAGFVVLRGRANISFAQDSDNKLVHQLVLPLTGYVNAEPFLIAETVLRRNQWSSHHHYHIRPQNENLGRDTHQLPVHLIPSLVPETGQQELQLELHWGPSLFPSDTLRLDRIKKLDLMVPSSFGSAEVVIPSATNKPETTASSDETLEFGQTLSWENRDANEKRVSGAHKKLPHALPH